MSVKDFYNSVTPGSSITHGVGRGVYAILNKDDVSSQTTYENEKLPTHGGPSILNEVQIFEVHIYIRDFFINLQTLRCIS